jgi:opacity protein-like surface antigen
VSKILADIDSGASMKRHLSAAALLLATASLASAADLSVPRYTPPAASAVYNWTGFPWAAS